MTQPSLTAVPAPVNPPADQVRALLCTTLMAATWLVRQKAPLSSAVLLRVFDDIILFAFSSSPSHAAGYFVLKQPAPGTLLLQRVDAHSMPVGFLPGDAPLHGAIHQAYVGLMQATGQEPALPSASVLPASPVLQ